MQRRRSSEVDQVMGPDFQPLSALWEGADAPYPSEQSVRWAMRTLAKDLAANGALARHRGMVFVHRAKLLELARAHAISAAQRQYIGGVKQ